MPSPLWETATTVCSLIQKQKDSQPGGSHTTAGGTSIVTHRGWGTGALLQGQIVVTLSRQFSMMEKLHCCRLYSSYC